MDSSNVQYLLLFTWYEESQTALLKDWLDCEFSQLST